MRWPTKSLPRAVPALLLALIPQALLAQTPSDPGARVYASACAACHQANGQGVISAFPPLAGHVPSLLGLPAGRDYLIRVVLFGLAGEISVNGQNFSGAMAPWESLSDGDIAAALNYVATAWNNRQRLPADFKPFQPGEIAAARSEKLSANAVHALRRKLMPAEQQARTTVGTPGLASYTEAQAAQGKATYQHNCEDCHGSTLDNGEFGGAPLRGQWFRNKWGNGSVANLYAYTKAKMPPDRPGGLSDKVYADVVAYILSVNGYKASNQELPTDPKAQQSLTLKRE